MSYNISNIRRITYLLNESTVKLLINSLVLSHLNYCPTVWSSASKKDLFKLQLTQNRAARLALRCSIRESVMSMHKSLTWMLVEERLAYSLIMFLRKTYTSHKPVSLFLQL